MKTSKVLPGTILILLLIFSLTGSLQASETKSKRVSPMDKTEIFERIKAAVDSIRLIDTHEHQVTEDLRLERQADLFFWMVQPWGFTQNTDSDLMAAGLTEQDRVFISDPAHDPQQRWAKLAPYWEATKYTSYARPVIIAAKDIHGVDDISESTWRTLNEKIMAAEKPGIREKILHEMAGIDLLILDKIVWVDSALDSGPPPRTVMVKRFDDFTLEDNFVQPAAKDIKAIGEKYDMQIESLDDLLIALDRAFEDIIRRGYYVGLKTAMAYDRIIRFDDTPREVAEKIFDQITSRELTREQRRPLEDFMMHQVIRRAGKYGLPVQIHTGAQLGPGNDITNARPTHLLNLFQKYPETTFVIFHGGFPYMGELTAMVKNYANVHLDMCLMPVFSMSVAREWLHKWLETLPVNKINVFGGDCMFLEGTYGHSVMARRLVTETLAGKVAAGDLSVEDALKIARMILRENAVKLYRLERFL